MMVKNSHKQQFSYEPSSVTINTKAQCAMLYYEKPKQWLAVSTQFPLRLGQFTANGFVLLENVTLNKVSSFTATNDPAYTKLHLSGLPDNPSESRLIQLFNLWNIPVLHIGIHRNQDSHKQKGFGFMWLKKEDAPCYVNTKQSLKGKWLTIKKAIPPKRKDPQVQAPPPQ